MNRIERSDELSLTDQLIDRFVTGKMRDAERAAFEMRVAKDPELQELVSAERFIQSYATRVVRAFDAPKTAIVSPALLRQVEKIRPKKLWAAYAAGIGYALALAAVLYSIYPNRTMPLSSPNRMTDHPRSVITAVDTLGIPAANLPVTSLPATEGVTPSHDAHAIQPATVPESVSPPKARDFDEPGPPRVYEKDSVSVKIHTK